LSAARHQAIDTHSALTPVRNGRPELVPVKWTAEFTVVTFLAVPGAQRPEVIRGRRSAAALLHVETAGTVAAFATHIHELR
jgi:hypothetical protein